MTRDEIEKTDKGVLEDLAGRPHLLVTFGGIHQGLGMPVFEFFNTIADIDCDKVYLRDFRQAWYHQGVDSERDSAERVRAYLETIIENNNYRKVCFLGNSMGGYAAILFGSLLNVHKVVAFAPQSFINPWYRFLYRDSRWQQQLRQLYSCEGKRKEFFDLKSHLHRQSPSQTQIDIYFGISHKLDKRHAERLRKAKGVGLYPLEATGHGVVKAIRANEGLRPLIQAALN